MQRCVMEGRVRSFLFNYADVVLDRCSQRTESSLDQGLGTVLIRAPIAPHFCVTRSYQYPLESCQPSNPCPRLGLGKTGRV